MVEIEAGNLQMNEMLKVSKFEEKVEQLLIRNQDPEVGKLSVEKFNKVFRVLRFSLCYKIFRLNG